jgi:hypothetical protein
MNNDDDDGRDVDYEGGRQEECGRWQSEVA